MRYFVLILIVFLSIELRAQNSNQSIKVHFFYGSKPKFKYRHVEERRFGGLHGGHVSMQIGDTVFSFLFTGRAHIFAHKRDMTGVWVNQNLHQWVNDTVKGKYVSFTVPLNNSQYQTFKKVQSSYCSTVPYDYAFLGMRCASSTYDVFAQMGFFKHRSRMSMITEIFYPKLLRKKFFRMAEKNHWKIEKHEGSPRRKWERR
jgi:hypothetical protein